MPLNGKANPVSKPSWLKDSTTPQSTTTPAARPSWARKTPEAKSDDSPKPAIGKAIKKDVEPPKKEVTSKLMSREIKVPLRTEKTIPTQSILKKPDVKIKQDLKEEQTTLPRPDLKSTSKSPSKTPSTTPSKSPSKTPDIETDSEEESSYETETDTDETDSEEDFSEDEKPSKKTPPPAAPKKPIVSQPLKKVAPPKEPERSQSPEYTFKKPELKKVITRQKSDAKERSTSPEPKFLKTKLRKVPSSLRIKDPPPREKLPVVELKKAPPKAEPEKSARKMSEQFPHRPSIVRAESSMKSE